MKKIAIYVLAAFGLFQLLFGETSDAPHGPDVPVAASRTPGAQVTVEPDKRAALIPQETKVKRAEPIGQPPALAAVAPDKAAKVTAPRTPDYVYVTASTLNVRAGPSRDQKIIWKAKRGTKLDKLRIRNGWAWINGHNGSKPVSGWVSVKYLSAQKPPIVSTRTAPPKRGVAAPSSRELANARREIIRQSIARTPGNCPCPYHKDRAGRRCGKRSAWSRPGGHSPICYDSDISNARLQTYLARRR